MTGVLNCDTFQTQAQKFVQLSDKLDDGWKVVNPKSGDSEELFYLEKKQVIVCADTPKEDPNDSPSGHLEPRDSKEFHVPGSGNYLNATYHVIFSQSYQVPVLYFKITRPDGRPLTLDEVWQRVPDPYRSQLEAHKWSMLTQQEHPILGQPYHWLHPCHTEMLMKMWDPQHWNYLVTWLSSVGPVVGLHLKPEYAKLSQASN